MVAVETSRPQIQAKMQWPASWKAVASRSRGSTNGGAVATNGRAELNLDGLLGTQWDRQAFIFASTGHEPGDEVSPFWIRCIEGSTSTTTGSVPPFEIKSHLIRVSASWSVIQPETA